MNAAQIVEAVLFASEAPLHAEEIARADESLNEDVVEEAIQDLRAFYAESERAYQIQAIAGGYQILTRSEFSTYLERFDTVPRPSRLSGPALETLSIIAYRQPIGRVEVEYIRGVSSSGVIRTLQDRDLVEVVGREEGIGRPFLYGTTDRFLEHFGFDSLEELPRPEELPVILRDSAPVEELEEEAREELAEDLEELKGASGGEEKDGPAGSDGAEEEREGEPRVATVGEDAPRGDDSSREGSPPPAGGGPPEEEAEAEAVPPGPLPEPPEPVEEVGPADGEEGPADGEEREAS